MRYADGVGSRSRAAAAVSLVVCAGVGCSLAVDTGGLSGGSGVGGPDASSDARGFASSSSGGGGDGGGADGGGCAKVRITVPECDDASYVPKSNGGAVATRSTNPEVLMYGHHNGPVFAATVTIDDRRTEPHHLVLATHDATKWIVNTTKPEALLSIVLSGYEASTVSAPAGVLVKPGAAKTPYAYDAFPPDYDDLVAYAKSQTGASAVTAFAGCHDAEKVVIEDACP